MSLLWMSLTQLNASVTLWRSRSGGLGFWPTLSVIIITNICTAIFFQKLLHLVLKLSRWGRCCHLHFQVTGRLVGPVRRHRQCWILPDGSGPCSAESEPTRLSGWGACWGPLPFLRLSPRLEAAHVLSQTLPNFHSSLTDSFKKDWNNEIFLLAVASLFQNPILMLKIKLWKMCLSSNA